MFFNRLQVWYKNWKQQFDTEPLTDDSKYHFINLSLFYAEMFVRVRVVSYCSNSYLFDLIIIINQCCGLGRHSIQRVSSGNLGIH